MLISLKQVAYAPPVEMAIMRQRGFSPDGPGPGQPAMADTDAASRPWIAPTGGGGYLGSYVSGPQQSWASVAMVSSASLNSARERVGRTDGMGQFPAGHGLSLSRL